MKLVESREGSIPFPGLVSIESGVPVMDVSKVPIVELVVGGGLSGSSETDKEEKVEVSCSVVVVVVESAFRSLTSFSCCGGFLVGC